MFTSSTPHDSPQAFPLVALRLVTAVPIFGTPSVRIEAPHSREADCPSGDLATTRSRAARGEGGDDYPAIARINGSTRIIECKDRLQWIMQTREGRRWRSLSFHRDRDVLIERSGATGAALATLLALPERHQ